MRLSNGGVTVDVTSLDEIRRYKKAGFVEIEIEPQKGQVKNPVSKTVSDTETSTSKRTGAAGAAPVPKGEN